MATLFVQHSSIYNNEKKTNFGSKFCLIILKKLSNTKPGQNFTKFVEISPNLVALRQFDVNTFVPSAAATDVGVNDLPFVELFDDDVAS